jgi:hypothetical protein
MNDRTLFKVTLAIIFLPILIISGCDDRFRYPCQNPDNWDKTICQLPTCDVTRTCPQHIFKGQRDPRLGPETDDPNKKFNTPTPTTSFGSTTQGVNCGK